MSQTAQLPSCEQSWCTSPRLQIWAIWFLGALAVFQGFWAVCFRDGDFVCHRNCGLHFLEGRLERDHYLPVRGLMDVPLAIVPYRVARAICYCVTMVMLLVCYRLWNEMAARLLPASVPVVRAAGILTILLLLPYVIRDLDECGLQFILVFFLTMAGWTLSRGQSLQSGYWLATAACYKVTPMLFLPFLLWKRQWRAAASMSVFLVLWCLAPSLRTGWDRNVEAHQTWYATVKEIKVAREAYPSLQDREPPMINNMSLLAGIARYLETYPPGHPLYIDQVGFLQFGRLPPATACMTLDGILGALGLWFAWKTRRPWTSSAAGQVKPPAGSFNGAFVGEWAAVCVLCALLSPVCWKQHMVLIVPCFFLVVRSVLNTVGPHGWRMALIWTCSALLCLFPGPNILGGDVSAVLHSYKLHTLGATMLMLWALFLPRDRAEAARHFVPAASEAWPRAA